MYPELAKYPYVALDTETEGVNWWEHKVFGLAITTPDGQSHYFDFREDPDALRWARAEIPRIRRPIFHNGKFDIHMLREAGVHVNQDSVEDTMIRAALIDEHLMLYDLDSLANKYVGIGKDTSIYQKLANMFGGKATKDAQMKNLKKAPFAMVHQYATQDTISTLKLWQYQEDQIRAMELGPVYRLEQDLLPVLVDMEHRGVRVDLDRAHRAQGQLDHEIKGLQRQLNEMAGFKVNPNPSGSIHKLFNPQKQKDGEWYACDGTLLNKTDAGKASLDTAALERMTHPAASVIIELRELIRAKDVFIKGHILGHHHNGVIHANFNQTKSDNQLGTGTGRLSCNSPALQQIHKRKKRVSAIVRSIFIPDEGQLWNCRDWSQMDFRVFAHYVENPAILSMYRSDPDADYHQVVADLTGLPRSKTPGRQGNAKQINLGLVFGMGPGKMAKEMGLPYTVKVSNGRERLIAGDEAKGIFARYHEAVPGVQALLDKASAVATSRGYVKTIMGRRIRFPEGKFTHKAAGLIFQGSAADALKLKLVEVHRELKDSDGRLVINVHDEFDTSLPPGDEGVALNKRIQERVETFDGPIKFLVPIRSTGKFGPNWWEASKD